MKRSPAVFAALALALRAPGLFTDFWLDEARGLSNLAPLDSPLGVLTRIHHDSNHWLTSFWMYALGQDAPFWAYRLPSLVAGVVSVPVAGRLAAALEGSSPPLVMLFAATSFPLAFYSSEARGYSFAALFALVLVSCLVQWVETGRGRWFGAYSLAVALGILSHLSFVLVVVAAAGYALVLAGRGILSFRRALGVALAPSAVLSALFVIDLRLLSLGGGTTDPPFALLAETASLALGGPVEGWAVLPFAFACALVLWAALRRQIRSFWPIRGTLSARSHLWVFFVTITLLPVWVAFALDPPFLFPRYFLVATVFVPYLAADLALSLKRPWPALAAALWTSVNGLALVRFAGEGRGRYEDTLRFALASSESEVVAVGSDHDLRNGTLVAFYRERMGEAGARLRYARAGEESEFWIASYEGSRCEGCLLLRRYPSSALSGARWALYRVRASSGPSPLAAFPGPSRGPRRCRGRRRGSSRRRSRPGCGARRPRSSPRGRADTPRRTRSP